MPPRGWNEQGKKTMKPAPESLHYNPQDICCAHACLGELFPDLLRLKPNTLNKGRVFGIQIDSCGAGVQGRTVVVDPKAWKACSQSPGFENCLQLSLAKLAAQQAALHL